MSGFDDHFQASDLAVCRHERRGGGALSIRMIRLDSPAHAVVDPPTDDLVVGLVTGGTAGAHWAWDGARPNATASRRRGELGLTPVGAQGTFEVDGASTILIVALPYKGLIRRLEPDVRVPRDFGTLHDVYSAHPIARDLCRRLWRTAGAASFGRDDRIDALAESLLVALSGGERGSDDEASGLARHDRARMMARADGPAPDVAALAEAVGMPVRTFRRRFAVTYGSSPQHWLAERRIRSAKMLLKARQLPLSEVALELGFSSQAHFTEAFRRAVGVAPGRWRSEAAG